MAKIGIIQEQMDNPNKGYIALAVSGWQWEIERIQNALYAIFGGGDEWEWNDPYTYHVTLAYSDNVTDAQLLETTKVIAGMCAPEIEIVGIGTFQNDTSGEQTVYLKIDPCDMLIELQKAIYDSLVGQGVILSPNSDPAVWVPHMTLATAPMDAVIPETELDIHTYTDKVCITRDGYQSLAEIPLKWEIPDMYAEDGMGPVQEMSSWKVGGVSMSDMPTMGADVVWDGAAAAKSIFTAAKFDSDTPDLALVKRAFLLYNASAPKLRGSYKVPIVKMVNGKMMMMPQGLRTAASRLPQVKGVPADVIQRATDKLAALKKKAGIGEMEVAPAASTAPAAPIAEQNGKQFVRMTYISEMRGNYPDIPTPTDVNLEDLKTIDGVDKIDFFTLPIGQVDAQSGNGRTYLRSSVEELVQQVNDMRPEGMWGHLTEEEMATRYDPPAIRWIAAMLDSKGVAWGKLLPLTEEAMNYYRKARATNARVGTSLTAFAEMQQNNVMHIELKTIDVADPRRVGIATTAALPHLTQEMESDTHDPISTIAVKQNHDVFTKLREKGNEIMELTETQITELKAAVTERDGLKTKVSEFESRITELQTKLDAAQSREAGYQTSIGELLQEYIVAEVKEQVVLASARNLITRLVILEQPQNRDAVKAAVKKVVDSEDVQEVLKATVVKEMGPKQTEQQKPKDEVVKTDQENAAQFFNFPAINIPQREVREAEAV